MKKDQSSHNKKIQINKIIKKESRKHVRLPPNKVETDKKKEDNKKKCRKKIKFDE